MKESEIQKAILDWLAAKRILAFRMNSSLTVTTYKGKSRAFRSGVVGMADVLTFPRKLVPDYSKFTSYNPVIKMVDGGGGAPLWIECKAPKGQQSDAQRSFQLQVESYGHRYILAYSLDDVIKVLGCSE